MPTPNSLERITRTPAAAGVFEENAIVDQVLDVTEGSFMRALPDLRPRRRGQLHLAEESNACREPGDAEPLKSRERFNRYSVSVNGFSRHSVAIGIRKWCDSNDHLYHRGCKSCRSAETP